MVYSAYCIFFCLLSTWTLPISTATSSPNGPSLPQPAVKFLVAHYSIGDLRKLRAPASTSGSPRNERESGIGPQKMHKKLPVFGPTINEEWRKNS